MSHEDHYAMHAVTRPFTAKPVNDVHRDPSQLGSPILFFKFQGQRSCSCACCRSGSGGLEFASELQSNARHSYSRGHNTILYLGIVFTMGAS